MRIPEYIKECISYNPESGVLRWVKVRTARLRIGDEITCKNSDGYIVVKFDGRQIRAHRLAWFLTYGVEPPSDIDHINGARNDNRLCNLRLATQPQNGFNSRKIAKSKTDIKGVSPHGSGFRARCSVNGKQTHIGTFRTMVEADNAVREFRENNHREFHNHG